MASGIRSLAAARRLFCRQPSARVLAVGLAAAMAVRLSLIGSTGVRRWDLLAAAVVVALVPLVEWFIHRVVLHAEPRRLGRLTVDTGYGHRQHHLHPASVNWVLLRGVDAGLFQVVNAAAVTVVIGGPLLLAGVAPLGPVLTGIVVAIGALIHYEWAHFLFHTAYRPKTRYYRRLKANHRLHHWRNERYWLGITTNLGDRLLRTHPADRSAVARSATARTLGMDPEGTGPAQSVTADSGR